jgi:predicted HicB family RNase H-like nuclease
VLLCGLLLQVAEHKRAVDRMLEEKRERYEEARRAEEAETAARCAQALHGAALQVACGSSESTASLP